MSSDLVTNYLPYGNSWIWNLTVLGTAHRWVLPWSTACAGLLVVKQSRIIQRANEKKQGKLLQLGHLDFNSEEEIFLSLNKTVSQLDAACPPLMIAQVRWKTCWDGGAAQKARAVQDIDICILKFPMSMHLRHVPWLLPVLVEMVV